MAIEQKTVTHLGIIMDGNRRWARAKGLKPFEGHRVGYKKVKEVLEWCRDAGIKILTLFTFSTENGQRPKEEIDFLMRLFYMVLTKEIKTIHKNNICLKIIGRKDWLSKKLQEASKKAEELTKNNTGGILNLAINYGGRQELVDAFNKILKKSVKEVTKETISENLYTAGQPDPDLIVRTSGEMRTSGFLTWQAAYSELYFVSHHWPDFSKKDFDEAITSFTNRHRRFGK